MEWVKKKKFLYLMMLKKLELKEKKKKPTLKIKNLKRIKKNVDKCGKIFKRVRDPLDLNYYVYFGTKWY